MAECGNGAVVALAELAEQVRQTTLQLLHVPEPSWLTWSPPGTSNHILWHAGHALWLQDVLTIQQLTGQSQLQSGWAAMFSQGSNPAAVQSWPSASEIGDLLDRQLSRITALLFEHAPRIAAWAEEDSLISSHSRPRTPLAAIVHC
jgi:DinB superfamily